MKKALFTISLFSYFTVSSQTCTAVIYPESVQPGGSNYHILSDTTVNDQDGSNYYVCSGVTLTVDYSAGCNYQLENGAILIINAHEGDNVFAKGNCTITDYEANYAIVVNMESTSTFTKPNNPSMGIVFNCPTMTFDYSQVGGSSPCDLNGLDEMESAGSFAYPNPVRRGEILNIGSDLSNVQLYNMCGQLIQKNTINTTELLEGSYILVGTTESNLVRRSILIVQ